MAKSTQMFGKYRILRAIGTGGFAKVYLGEHIYLKTQAAVKVLRVGPNVTSQELADFMAEARIVAKLKHPHIVDVLDFDIERGIPYLVMSYAPNGSLLTRHSAYSVLEPELVVWYVKQIATALQFAHDHQVVHCDVKPENMLLGNEDQILLTDFGIAVALHSNFQTQPVIGTMYYMAPEQFQGKPTPASDQYALAILAYRWLCGTLPFTGKSAFELQHLHEFVQATPLRQLNPHISPDIESVVLTGLAKDQRHRFASVSAFSNALEQATLRKPSNARPAASTPSQRKVARPDSIPPSAPTILPPSITTLLASKQETPALHLPGPLDPQCQPDSITYKNEKSFVRQAEMKAREPESKDGPPEIESIQHLPTRITQEPIKSRSSSKADKLESVQHLSTHIVDNKPASAKVEIIYTKHTGWIAAVAWSPISPLIASSSWDTTVQIWDATTGERAITYQGHRQPVKSISWSPDGASLVSGSWDNSVQIWNSKTGEIHEKYRHEAQIETVAWSPDGKQIASAGHDGTIQVWSLPGHQIQTIYTQHKKPVWSLSWSADSHFIASASHDRTVQIWEAQTGRPIITYTKHQQHVAAVAWSPDGQYIASSDYDGTVQVWDSQDGKLQFCYSDEAGTVKALAWSGDGTKLASAVKQVQIRAITKKAKTAPLPLCTYTGHSNWVNALAWSPNRHTIASAGDDKTVQIWRGHFPPTS